MTDQRHDIEDDEIRIISSAGRSEKRQDSKPDRLKRVYWIAAIALGLTALIFGISYCSRMADDSSAVFEDPDTFMPVSSPADTIVAKNIYTGPARVTVCDTIVLNEKLTILTPVNATPALEIGDTIYSDSTIVLAAQAADIRGDNGEIVGAFVRKGQLLSKGQSKSGFCAIISGSPVIGVANATPYLEQALETGGDFFRQYPLVVGGQVVENKPTNSALRKALVDVNGVISIVYSHSRLTLHEFSECLAALGASNAIYLVGSSSRGFYRRDDGSCHRFGYSRYNLPENCSFIVWR